jgi:hypothetical protein
VFGQGIVGVIGRGRIGVSAEGDSAALWISGSIKVPSAGIGTNTPVFIHKVNTAVGGNLCQGQNYGTVIDNSLINGLPGAILIVTASSINKGCNYQGAVL